MGNNIKSLLITIISTLLIVACTDSYMGIEQVKTSSVKPEKITINEVISKSGALEIHFTLPKGNPDISQVVASYISKQGEKMEFKVSRYSSSILVEGFIGTDEITVELACIDNSGNKSEITEVKAAPLISPVELALRTMKVEAAFGGVKVEWKNSHANPFVIHVLTADTLQKGVVSLNEDLKQVIYSSDSVNTFAYIRPYSAIKQEFGFYVTDKWKNRTDTLISSLTPYKEELIDYNLVEAISFFNPTYYAGSRDYDTYAINPATGIQNDGNCHTSNYGPQKMFNGVITANDYYSYKFVKNLNDPDKSKQELEQNVYATFDLHLEARLSRVKIYPRTVISYTYNRSSVKRFRIWGTNDDNTDRWAKFPETWTLIGEYVGKEPVDRDNLTAEEIEYFNYNQEYTISEDNVNPDASPTATFRYMRLQLMESYNPLNAYYTINEFEMFGDIQQYF
ncbi:DUF5126 domain-containing protein [Maribellus sp. CM-23]|uniref:DUF5126 domain-containing protein n=1 Tax=Maribellus sp. CM-23 TaxID=2781026 RepID=UPI001F28979B|nr:DUF5126 domain-containing protein [Maribellus sp. CM-23]MCE4564798.1 DUF5126 domain-containing protein [Maribellus sp. CM-23]